MSVYPVDFGGNLVGRLGIEQALAEGLRIGLERDRLQLARDESLRRGLMDMGAGVSGLAAGINAKRDREADAELLDFLSAEEAPPAAVGDEGVGTPGFRGQPMTMPEEDEAPAPAPSPGSRPVTPVERDIFREERDATRVADRLRTVEKGRAGIENAQYAKEAGLQRPLTPDEQTIFRLAERVKTVRRERGEPLTAEEQEIVRLADRIRTVNVERSGIEDAQYQREIGESGARPRTPAETDTFRRADQLGRLGDRLRTVNAERAPIEDAKYAAEVSPRQGAPAKPAPGSGYERVAAAETVRGALTPPGERRPLDPSKLSTRAKQKLLQIFGPLKVKSDIDLKETDAKMKMAQEQVKKNLDEFLLRAKERGLEITPEQEAKFTARAYGYAGLSDGGDDSLARERLDLARERLGFERDREGRIAETSKARLDLATINTKLGVLRTKGSILSKELAVDKEGYDRNLDLVKSYLELSDSYSSLQTDIANPALGGPMSPGKQEMQARADALKAQIALIEPAAKAVLTELGKSKDPEVAGALRYLEDQLGTIKGGFAGVGVPGSANPPPPPVGGTPASSAEAVPGTGAVEAPTPPQETISAPAASPTPSAADLVAASPVEAPEPVFPSAAAEPKVLYAALRQSAAKRLAAPAATFNVPSSPEEAAAFAAYVKADVLPRMPSTKARVSPPWGFMSELNAKAADLIDNAKALLPWKQNQGEWSPNQSALQKRHERTRRLMGILYGDPDVYQDIYVSSGGKINTPDPDTMEAIHTYGLRPAFDRIQQLVSQGTNGYVSDGAIAASVASMRTRISAMRDQAVAGTLGVDPVKGGATIEAVLPVFDEYQLTALLKAFAASARDLR